MIYDNFNSLSTFISLAYTFHQIDFFDSLWLPRILPFWTGLLELKIQSFIFNPCLLSRELLNSTPVSLAESLLAVVMNILLQHKLISYPIN